MDQFGSRIDAWLDRLPAAFAAWRVILALAVANGAFRDAFLSPSAGGNLAALLTSGILLMLCSHVVGHVPVCRRRSDSPCQCVGIGLFWNPRQLCVERQAKDRFATKQVHGNDKARDNWPAPAAAGALRPRAAGTAPMTSRKDCHESPQPSACRTPADRHDCGNDDDH
ncbi:MAG: hypothetical protein JNN21_10375 [Candidatus Accumulibacter sp.]|nr:hypothetical protein [Accumulibacter sp.]